MTPRSSALVCLALVSVLGLAGCVGTVEETPTPTPPATTGVVETPTPTAEPTPTEPPATVSLPETCEQLLPLELVISAFGEEWETATEIVELDRAIPGPTARAAATAAEQSLSCTWWPEAASEGHLAAFAFVLDDATRTELVTGLQSAESYDPVDIAGADEAFMTSVLKGDLIYTTMYAFVDDVWTVVYGPLRTDIVTTLAGNIVDRV